MTTRFNKATLVSHLDERANLQIKLMRCVVTLRFSLQIGGNPFMFFSKEINDFIACKSKDLFSVKAQLEGVKT